jgi:hypothetical protein
MNKGILLDEGSRHRGHRMRHNFGIENLTSVVLIFLATWRKRVLLQTKSGNVDFGLNYRDCLSDMCDRAARHCRWAHRREGY